MIDTGDNDLVIIEIAFVWWGGALVLGWSSVALPAMGMVDEVG